MAGLQAVTLVTGASSGIGAALARKFARHGHALVLVARRLDKLEAVAEEVAALGGPRPVTIAADLTQTDAPEHIAEALRSRGLEPQYVINNAGFGLLGPAAELDRDEQLAMVDLHIRTVTDLSLRWVDSLERHRGGILNVASVLGFVPGPGMAVYHATKAYIISFSQALHHELKPRGIRVTAFCPGPVDTEFSVRAVGPLSRRTTRSIERVVREGYEGLVAGELLVVPGFDNWLISVMPRVLPRGLMLSLFGRSRRKRLGPPPE